MSNDNAAANGIGEDADSEARGFQFPGDFDITVVGDAEAELLQRVPRILQDAKIEMVREAVSKRPSREGNYHAVLATVHCNNRQEYEQAHAALRADKAIHVTL